MFLHYKTLVFLESVLLGLNIGKFPAQLAVDQKFIGLLKIILKYEILRPLLTIGS